MMLTNPLSGASRAQAIANQISAKSSIIVTANESHAALLYRELLYFRPDTKSRLLHLPDSETLPFDLETSPASIMSQRAYVLSEILAKKVHDKILILSAANCMRKLAGQGFWTSYRISLKVGTNINEALPDSTLTSFGYTNDLRARNPGFYAKRGLVLDIFPIGMASTQSGYEHLPVRIVLDNDGTIVSMRRYDALTQESTKTTVDELILYPYREFDIKENTAEQFARAAFEAHSNPREMDVYKAVRSGKNHPELASWISVIDDEWTSATRLPGFSEVIFSENSLDEFQKQWELIRSRHADISNDTSRLCPPVDASWVNPDVLLGDINTRMKLFEFIGPVIPSGMKRTGSLSDALSLLGKLMLDDIRTLFVIQSTVRSKHIKTMCKMIGHPLNQIPSLSEFETTTIRTGLTHGSLSEGYTDFAKKIRVITEVEVFGMTIEASFEEELGEHQRKVILQGLSDVKKGDPLVHALHGVGRLQGFESINMGDSQEDLLKVGYANDSSIFVRISDLEMVSRYSGSDPEKAPLSDPADRNWLKGLLAAQNSAFKVAKELIDVRNNRNRASGVVLKEPGKEYFDFCETFQYEETPDQARAINDIVKDLASGKPMDRLICGDVGFGKTEVAMRAAFLMASSGFQVALLAPTTLLAEQHYNTIVKRFEDTPLKAVLMTRSLSKAEAHDASQGGAEIIVGTHRILQGDINFKNLGLIIVDEEQRFGVKQKELLRSLRGNKHMLAMAATPIPRTLGMAISGIRDISIIATPPARRLSVRTIVRDDNDSIIREAIGRELSRNGQVFFLHNRVSTMDHCVARLSTIAPSARIRKIHGKMSPGEMTDIMLSFRKKDFDILVCTTVIEVGIDVPNANTLIIEEADKLGLGQLHQLRGRVGRSTRQAYAYLLSEGGAKGAPLRRLEAMAQSTNLGEGVLLARHDMEIRGIGEVLGEEQSGHIHNIGFSLYMRLLEQAIKAIDEDKAMADATVILRNVNMPIEGFIPSSFMPDTGERLAWYQRLMASVNPHELDQNLSELEDLYGYIPKEIVDLKTSIEHHIAAKKWGIQSIRQVGGQVKIEANITCNIHDLSAMLALSFKGDLETGEKERVFYVAGTSVNEVGSRIRSSTRF